MSEPLLSVVVPAYNQAGSIVENLDIIERRIREGLGEPFELIVVSDGSGDRTEELVRERGSELWRVLHYDRNLGKGYALKLGGLAARGRWIGFVDADLDLDPASIPRFLRLAEERSLDIVVGSKRHPDSVVDYPRSRRVASWLYQRLVRVLFQLDVRDTQVGLKLVRSEVARDVLPLLLVKRFAFDLELLAVSRALGFTRIVEQPIELRYRFAGSGVRSLAVLRALVDTAAIFYRLRLLRYYQRKRRLLGPLAGPRQRELLPRVTVLAPADVVTSGLDYPSFDRVELAGAYRAAVEAATGELVAFVGGGSALAANWLSATVPFTAVPGVEAVVTPALAPAAGGARARAAAAIQESRLGGGSQYFRFTPGNLRVVSDFPGAAILVRRDAYLALEAEVPPPELAAAISAHGGTVVYTPETVVVTPVPPLLAPHLRRVSNYGRRRGRALRAHGVRAARASTLLALCWWGLLVLGAPLLALGRWPARVWTVSAIAYAAAIGIASLVAALRFRSPTVGVLALAAFPVTHLVYAASLLRGVVSR